MVRRRRRGARERGAFLPRGEAAQQEVESGPAPLAQRARAHAGAPRPAVPQPYQLLIDALPTHVALLDARGDVVAVNEAWRAFGRARGLRDRAFGVGTSYLAVCGARGARNTEGPQVARAIRDALRGVRAFLIEYPCDGPANRTWFRARVAPVSAEGPVRALVEHQDVTALRCRRGVDLPARGATPEQAVDAERRRIARWLHDSASQQIATAALEIASARRLLGKAGTRARAPLGEAASLCARSLEEVRALSYELSPPLLGRVGLAAALRAHVEAFSRRTGIAVQMKVRSRRRPRPEVELALFEVAGEALRNVQRHARARSATVRLLSGPDAVRIEIADDGRGWSRAGAPLAGGQGVAGMRDRVAACGGRLEILSPGTGTVVRAIVPERRASDHGHPAR